MDIRKLGLLIGALLIASVTALAARGLFTQAATPRAAQSVAAAPVTTEVLVAARSLPVGTIIDQTSLRFQPWPNDMMNDGYIRKDKGDAMRSLVGTVVRYAVAAGQPVLKSALVKPGDRGFLAAALMPGMRAVTIPVSTTTGVGGFIYPGDRVDLVLTQNVMGGGDGQPLKASETIIRNIRVLALDQSMARPAAKEGDEKPDAAAKPASTVTIEVTPKMVERINVAQTIGTLSLSLRSLADSGGNIEAAIADGEISVNGNDPAAEKAMLASLAVPDDRRSSVTVGSEVSRFQRSTVPGKSELPEEEEAKRLSAAIALRNLRARTISPVTVLRGGQSGGDSKSQ